MDARLLEHRLQLLSHDSVRAKHNRSFRVVQRQQSLGVLLTPAFRPARDQPARMRVLERQRFHRIRRRRAHRRECFALPIGATQHCIYELARAESVTALGQLDGLGDGRVRRNAPHVGELVDAEPQQVDDVGIEARQPTAHAVGKNRVDPGAVTQHPVHELARPAAIARVERSDPSLEGLIEELSSPEIDADLGGDGARRGDSARRYDGGVHAPSIPVVGEDGTATSRRGIRPAR